MIGDLKFNFHDAGIVKCHYSSAGDFVLWIQLYEIDYPQKQTVLLTFSEIFNPNKVATLSKRDYCKLT